VVDLDDVHIVDISLGGWHSLALSNKGEVYAWGEWQACAHCWGASAQRVGWVEGVSRVGEGGMQGERGAPARQALVL